MSNSLTPKQVQAVMLLAQGESGRAVAEAVGVAPQTISDWRKLPAFEALLNRIKRDALETARDKLQAASGTAVEALVELATNAKNTETRRRAAMDILSMTGYAPNTQELFAWGVGATEPGKVIDEREQSHHVNTLLKSMMDK